MKPTVTILHRKKCIALFRLPGPGSVAHRRLGNGLTVLGDGDILQLPFEPHDKKASCRLADGCALDEVATAPKWLLNYGAGATVRVIEVSDIKITDIVVDPNHRPLIPEKVAEIGKSIAEIGQTNPITVTPRKDGKFDLVSGNHRRAAAKSLGWTEIRAQIVEGDKTEVRLWAIADDLHRAGLTVLQEAERTAEWVRSIEARERVYRQKTANRKTGRPEGAVAKAARELPVKGTTEKARRKRIEHDLKIASISAEARTAAEEAGLGANRDALYQIAKEKTAENQLAKFQEITKRKAAPKTTASTRGFGKRKTKTKRMPLPSSLSAEEKEHVKSLVKMWHDAHDLKRAFAKATPAVCEGFIDRLRQFVADVDNDPEDDSEACEQEDQQEEQEEQEEQEDQEQQEEEEQQENEQDEQEGDWAP